LSCGFAARSNGARLPIVTSGAAGDIRRAFFHHSARKKLNHE
jgi:hypothetical protein